MMRVKIEQISSNVENIEANNYNSIAQIMLT